MLFVGFAPMSNVRDVHDVSLVIDLENHPVVADSKPPELFAAAQLPDSGRAGIGDQFRKRCKDSVLNLARKSSEIPLRRAGEKDLVFSHAACGWGASASSVPRG